MDEQNLRKMVEQMVEQMVGQAVSSQTPNLGSSNSTNKSKTISSNKNTVVSGESLPDITKIDLKSWFLLDHAKNKEEYLHMKSKTPARLGLGRAGARYKTMSMLRFRGVKRTR